MNFISGDLLYSLNENRQLVVTFPNFSVTVFTESEVLTYTFTLPPELQQRVRGLMGEFYRNLFL